ncbi:hypothetical protein [Aureibacter tunicatorum]|uniref:Uncharacterized protein n=1 Tax=Aureibacter tunicatorum TaxID=866807 RepID=A0AAE4BNX3_9BACT|nr:hypothetical protein [Aureibacter tunicatorum]MDR6237309.1 hypothetical protein [Aureibacter tunicatorum]BDD06300.1 hypothetical protein AUTU_37830 [Aureibacter tunicatorum]
MIYSKRQVSSKKAKAPSGQAGLNAVQLMPNVEENAPVSIGQPPIQALMSLNTFKHMTMDPSHDAAKNRFKEHPEIAHIEVLLARYEDLASRSFNMPRYKSRIQVLYELERHCNKWYSRFPLHSNKSAPYHPYTVGILDLIDDIDLEYIKVLDEFTEYRETCGIFLNRLEGMWVPDNAQTETERVHEHFHRRRDSQEEGLEQSLMVSYEMIHTDHSKREDLSRASEQTTGAQRDQPPTLEAANVLGGAQSLTPSEKYNDRFFTLFDQRGDGTGFQIYYNELPPDEVEHRMEQLRTASISQSIAPSKARSRALERTIRERASTYRLDMESHRSGTTTVRPKGPRRSTTIGRRGTQKSQQDLRTTSMDKSGATPSFLPQPTSESEQLHARLQLGSLSMGARRMPRIKAVQEWLDMDPSQNLEGTFKNKLQSLNLRLMMCPTGRLILEKAMHLGPNMEPHQHPFNYEHYRINVFAHTWNDETAYFLGDSPEYQEIDVQTGTSQPLTRREKLAKLFKRRKKFIAPPEPFHSPKEALNSIGRDPLGGIEKSDILIAANPRKETKFLDKSKFWDEQKKEGYLTLTPKVIEYCRVLIQAIVTQYKHKFRTVNDETAFAHYLENQVRKELKLTERAYQPENVHERFARDKVLSTERMYGKEYASQIAKARKMHVDDEWVEEKDGEYERISGYDNYDAPRITPKYDPYTNTVTVPRLFEVLSGLPGTDVPDMGDLRQEFRTVFVEGEQHRSDEFSIINASTDSRAHDFDDETTVHSPLLTRSRRSRLNTETLDEDSSLEMHRSFANSLNLQDLNATQTNPLLEDSIEFKRSAPTTVSDKKRYEDFKRKRRFKKLMHSYDVVRPRTLPNSSENSFEDVEKTMHLHRTLSGHIEIPPQTSTPGPQTVSVTVDINPPPTSPIVGPPDSSLGVIPEASSATNQISLGSNDSIKSESPRPKRKSQEDEFFGSHDSRHRTYAEGETSLKSKRKSSSSSS